VGPFYIASFIIFTEIFKKTRRKHQHKADNQQMNFLILD